MSIEDHFQYNALFAEDHSASVDWHMRRLIITDVFLATSINSNSCTKLFSDVSPFILDSGATICNGVKMSNECNTFLNLFSCYVLCYEYSMIIGQILSKSGVTNHTSTNAKWEHCHSQNIHLHSSQYMALEVMYIKD